MTHPPRSARARRIGVLALRLVLAAAFTVPPATLGVQIWRDDTAVTTRIERQRHGVAMLAAMGPLIGQLARAEIAAAAGRTVVPPELFTVADQTAAVDQRWGGELGTHDRWVTLRTAIDALRGSRPADLSTTYQDLIRQLGGLYIRVREQSDLVIVTDQQTYHLAQAATVDLPGGIAAVAADVNHLSRITLTDPDPQRIAAALAAREEITTRGDALSESLEHALAASPSGTLGASLVGGLDAYRQGLDQLSAAVTISSRTIADARSRGPVVVDTATALQATVLADLDTLLVRQSNQVLTHRNTAALIVTAGSLCAVIALLVAWLVSRRHRAGRPTRIDGVAADVGHTGGPGHTSGPGHTTRRDRQDVSR